jgi:alkylresorcinol/alkylpyrone synthase
MYLHALATAVPPARRTQAECWELIAASEARHRLTRRSRLILQSVLRGESGIATRHFAFEPIAEVFSASADALNETFRREAPLLAGRALALALERAGLRADQLDALLVCTCTGYLCPGVTSYVAEQLGLRPNAFLQDLVGLGCGAAIPTLRAAQGVLAVRPDAVVACIAVEICSAAFFIDDDPGVLVSACLFGDGAAATIWRATPPDAPRPALRATGFDTLHLPAARDKIRFTQRDGKLRNLLADDVPALAASAVARLFANATHDGPPPARILSHPGGRDVLDAIEAAVPGYALDASRRVLREFGNMSSPSVFFALEDALRAGGPAPGADWWLVAFGAGFAAHACRLQAASGNDDA